MSQPVIAYRFFGPASRPMFVCGLPSGGACYGYTVDENKALRMSVEQWRQFAKFCRDVQTVAFSIPADKE